MTSRRKGKLAIFVHGWDATSAVWNQPKSNPNAIKRLLEAKGYLVDQIDLPGKFMAHRKDFYYYAEFLAKKIDAYALPNSLSPQDDGWADEITLVCHSMGSVVALLYLREDIGDPEAKKKITQVIALASPFHGTSVPIKQIAHVFMPGIGDITFDAFMRRVVACYQQVQLASPFMRKLHSLPDRTPHIKFHCIWTRGDVVIAPNHTAIMEGASNYYIDSARVGHPDIMWNAETLRIIKDILDGKAKPSGLQTYPPAETGADHLHQWFPASGTNKHTRSWSAGEKRYFAWHCLNEGCHAAEISVNRPSQKGCSVGQSVEKRRWHKWQRTGLKRYVCNRCGLTVRETAKPLPTDTPECVRNGRLGKHDWRLQSHQWLCANESPSRKCGEKTWSLFSPSVRGCSDRIQKNDYHLWEKRESRFQYMFKCAVCRKTVWHSDKPAKGRAQA